MEWITKLLRNYLNMVKHRLILMLSHHLDSLWDGPWPLNSRKGHWARNRSRKKRIVVLLWQLDKMLLLKKWRLAREIWDNHKLTTNSFPRLREASTSKIELRGPNGIIKIRLQLLNWGRLYVIQLLHFIVNLRSLRGPERMVMQLEVMLLGLLKME